MRRKLSTALVFVVLMSVFGAAQNQQVLRTKDSASSALLRGAVSRVSSLPVAAQPAISATLGHDIKNYRVQVWRRGYQFLNEQQKLSAELAPGQINVRDNKAIWSIRLSGFGYGDAVEKPGFVLGTEVNSNRVEFRYARMTEWYVNGPAGIEQGFTIFHAPGAAYGKPLTISQTMLEGSRTQVNPDKKGAKIISPNARHLRYGTLIAYDAHGKHLPAWVEAQTGRILLRVDDTGASYPIVIDPLIQSAELTASDGAPGDDLGVSVAIRGNTIVVGAENATVGANPGQGAAYVFVKPANALKSGPRAKTFGDQLCAKQVTYWRLWHC